ncbi:MAG: hypothetical protein HWQ35_15525 [Nostoc sp. NMS1]|uniref:hypothetical protein n=1 Tax=Nostoc sp. NMS1 TaxID=2815388 RepID=UPI0025E3E5C7|nr:hypothetical protein [Nostoc sp. NMS1]MBN3907911.1 hypothetical protein [Nostoc sp. NMS1]
MSNYLFHLVAKSFNLIDTVQPLVLSVFEPLPESTLDWEPSITTDSTELETTSEAEKFPNFDIVQLLEKRSPATIGQISEEITNPLLTNLTSTPVQSSQPILKSIPNLTQKPDLELSSNWPFLDSVLTQISTNNQQFTSNPEQKISTTPLTFAAAQLSQKESSKINPVVSSIQPPNSEQKTSTTTLDLVLGQLSQKQLTKINPVVSSVQSSNIVNWERLITQSFVELERFSSTTNQIVTNPNTELLKSALVPQTKTSLSNHLVSVHNTESNTSLSNPIFEQRQIPLKSFPQQLITINRLGLSLQSPLKSDLQTYFSENPTKTVMFSFTPEEKIFSLQNLNPAISRTAIAKENNTPVSNLFEQESGKVTTKSLNNQPFEINQSAYPNSLKKVLHLRQYIPEIQAEASSILSIPSVLKQGKSTTENLHKQPIENNLVFIHSQLPQVESSEDFLPQLQSQSTAMSTMVNSWKGYTNVYAPAISQVLPLTPMLAVETSTPASSSVIQHQKQAVTELSSTQSLQRSGNVSSTQVQKLISLQPSIPEKPVDSAPVANQILPTNQKSLTPGLTLETSTAGFSPVIQHQKQSASELVQQQLPQIIGNENVLSLQVKKLINPQLDSNQFLEELVAMSTTGNSWRGYANTYTSASERVLSLTPVPTMDTSISALSPVIQPQVQHGAIPSLLYERLRQRDATRSLLPRRGTVSSANASTIDSTLANSHKQSLTPTIAIETIAEPQERLTSNVPENQQRFVHKNVSSIQPIVADASAKLSSLETNSSTAPFVNNLSSSIASQPITQLTAINSDIIPTPALHPSTPGIDIQSQVNFSDSHLSDFRPEKASAQEVGSQNYNTSDRKHIDIQKIGVVEQWEELGQAGAEMNVNYAYHPANMQRQKINPNEGIFTSPVENLILPQNPSPNLSMSADRFKKRQHIGSQKIGVVEQWDELRQGEAEMNVNYAHHPTNMQRQKINPNEGIFTSPVENSILPQNTSPNLSMSADRGKDEVKSLYFTQLEESDFRPLSGPINDLTVKNLSVVAASSKKAQKRWRSPSQTSPVGLDTPPKIQVTIGRLEIRSAAPAPPPPRPKPRPATSVMGLNEYLQRRARRR